MKSKKLALNYDKKYLSFFNVFIFFVIFFIDQFSKYLSLIDWLSRFNNKYLSFDFMINRGISCSLFHSEDKQVFYLVSFVVLMIIFIFLYYIKIKISEQKNIMPEILILSGAMSNFLDRIIHGGVIDFINISLNGFSFPIFNIADSSIVIGCILLLLELYNCD